MLQIPLYMQYETGIMTRVEGEKKADCKPEARSDSLHVPVQAAFRASNSERERPLQQAGKNLHLVCTAVLCNFEALDKELEGQNKKNKIK